MVAGLIQKLRDRVVFFSFSEDLSENGAKVSILNRTEIRDTFLTRQRGKEKKIAVMRQ